MLFFYWLFVGWWLEPILFILKLIFMPVWILFKGLYWLLIGVPIKIARCAFALMITMVLAVIVINMAAAVGVFVAIPIIVVAILVCILTVLAKNIWKWLKKQSAN